MKKVLGKKVFKRLRSSGLAVCAALLCAGCSMETDSGNGLAALMLASNSGALASVSGEQTPSSSSDSNATQGSGKSASSSSSASSAVGAAPTVADVSNTNVKIVKSEGWLNSAYIIFEQVEGATYKVLCDDKEIDAPLIRYYDTYTYYENSESNGQTAWTKKTLSKIVRADALGLAAGNHTIKVCAVGTENTSGYSTATMNVVDHDRSGFAFAPSAITTPGAYKADGTLKDNAIVLYVTGATAKTVSYTAKKGTNSSKDATFTGLQDVLSETSLKNLTVPLCIRIVGTITKDQMDSLGSSAEGVQIKTTSENGVTVEGVGHDAAVYGFGFLIRNAKYTELCNLGVFNFMDDGISVDTDNSYLWIHNNDISYGAVGSDSDQAKGDGSLDFKLSTYSTLSYNHFWDSGKCNLLDASPSSSGSNYLSYHHNWYDHSDSRHPRVRNATAVHVYNNYYDGNAKYGVGVTSGSSAFVEGNYFRNAHDPMMQAGQGTDAQGSGTFSGEDGGVIKAYNNKFAGNNTNGVKFQFVTNKYDYTNNVAVTEPQTHTESLGTANDDGTYTIYTWAYGDSFPSFITKNDAADKGATDSTKAYYQVSKGKTAFALTVPANASKVVIKAKSASSGVSSATLKVGGVSRSVTADNYPEYEFDVSSVSSTSLAVVAGSEGSINITSIKVIAPTAWETTYTTGISLSDIDAYEVDDRSTQVPGTVTTKLGGNKYSNFDVQLGDSGLGLSAAPTTPDVAKADVIKYAGRHNPDFAYTFNNATDDADYGVNSALKALVVGYTGGLSAVQGSSSGASSGNAGNSGNAESGESGNESGSTGTGESGSAENGDNGGTSGGTETPATLPEGTVVVTFDSFTSGATVNGVTVTGSLKSGVAEKTYNGTTYKTALKMESKTSITFTTTEAKTLTIVTDTASKKISIDGTKVSTDSDGVVTQSLAGGDHTISKGDAMNVYAIIISPAE